MRALRCLTIITAAAMLPLVACKPTEANYRAAYERAVEGRDDDSDIATPMKPMAMSTATISGQEVPISTTYLSVIGDDGTPSLRSPLLRQYCVVAGRFRQAFNAKSMAKRLVDNGFTNAFVGKTGDEYYLVLAGGADQPDQALTLMHELQQSSAISLTDDTWILHPAQLK